MEKLLLELIEKSKTNKKVLKQLKNIAVEAQTYELACQLREIENKFFPDSDEQKIAKKESKDLKIIFSMVELNVPEETCWLINETLTIYKKKKGKFDLRDSAKIITKTKELFNN